MLSLFFVQNKCEPINNSEQITSWKNEDDIYGLLETSGNGKIFVLIGISVGKFVSYFECKVYLMGKKQGMYTRTK